MIRVKCFKCQKSHEIDYMSIYCVECLKGLYEQQAQ